MHKSFMICEASYPQLLESCDYLTFSGAFHIDTQVLYRVLKLVLPITRKSLRICCKFNLQLRAQAAETQLGYCFNLMLFSPSHKIWSLSHDFDHFRLAAVVTIFDPPTAASPTPQQGFLKLQ